MKIRRTTGRALESVLDHHAGGMIVSLWSQGVGKRDQSLLERLESEQTDETPFRLKVFLRAQRCWPGPLVVVWRRRVKCFSVSVLGGGWCSLQAIV